MKILTKQLENIISNWTITKRKQNQLINLSSNRLYSSTKYRRQRQNITTITAMSLLTMATQTGKPLPLHFKVDTDSNTIGIDNRCSAYISDHLEDFLSPPQPCQRTIKGFGGAKKTNIMIITILWEWPDDTGKIHQFQTPRSYYVPHSKCRLLSPQNWAQTQSNKSSEGATGETTTATTSTLFWKGGAHKLKIPLSKYTNEATFST
jgi:hypothetical protein